MKILTTGFLLLFISINLRAQNDTASVNFIKATFRQTNIVYTDNVNQEVIDNMRNALKRDTIFSFIAREDTLVLTQTEHAFINKNLKRLKHHHWKAGLIENSKFIKIDSVKKILRQPNGWKYFQTHYGYQVYRFSKPIFFRNNTLCVFYDGDFCNGLCGHESLAIYKKEENSWDRVFVLYDELH